MKCPNCHADNPDTSRFCGSCAAPLSPLGEGPVSMTKTLETPVRALKAGSLIAGKYKIIDEIGAGGMGVVLYEILAGRLPFQGDHEQTVIYPILHREPESLSKVRPGTESGLEQIVGQALALEKGLEIHDPALPYLGYPCYDDVRPDPRFQDLLRQMNLPAEERK